MHILFKFLIIKLISISIQRLYMVLVKGKVYLRKYDTLHRTLSSMKFEWNATIAMQYGETGVILLMQ